MKDIDIDKYKIDAYIPLDVVTVTIEDAHLYENKPLKQQMQSISNLINAAFCSKAVSCEKILEVNGQHYCAIVVKKENELFDDADNFEENTVDLINDLNSLSDLFVKEFMRQNHDGASRIIDEFAESGRPSDLVNYADARMSLINKIEIKFRKGSVEIFPMEKNHLVAEEFAPNKKLTGEIHCGYSKGNLFDAQFHKGGIVTLEYDDRDKEFIQSNTYSNRQFEFVVMLKRCRFSNKTLTEGRLVSISLVKDTEKKAVDLFQAEESAPSDA